VANVGHRILDTDTGTKYGSRAAAGRDLAHLVSGDPTDQLVWFHIAWTYPERFRVLNDEGEWVRLDDPSAPVGTLRPNDQALVRAARTRSIDRLRNMEGIDLDKPSVTEEAWR